MDAGDGIKPSAEDAQASSVIYKVENPEGDLPDSSTSTHLRDDLKGEDADAEASSRNLFNNTNAGPFMSINQSGSVQLIPCYQGYENFTSWPRSPIMQCAVYSSNGTYFVSGKEGQATPGGMSTYEISSPVSGLSQVNEISSGSLPSPQQLAKDASSKREYRLMKNRMAAKEYRRRHKEYVRSLESRITMMENQNQKIMEELNSLKEFYTGKFLSY